MNQPKKLIPETIGVKPISLFRTEEYQNHSLKVWRDAVKIPTESYDDMGPMDKDQRWEVFTKFENYLIQSFPYTASAAELIHVNTHALVFIIPGSVKSLKPFMFTGHQDVVNVPRTMYSTWKYPPFEGKFDGEYLWGRGSNDCKNNVIGIFEAIESLLSQHYRLKRTLILGFGCDEELGGSRGANEINKYLIKRFGKNSLFMLLDEGGVGIQQIYGTKFALPSVGEKGYIDVDITLETSGGHSSVPPLHTSIGIMSKLVLEIENQKSEIHLEKTNPFWNQLIIEAANAKTISVKLQRDIANMGKNKEAKERVINYLQSIPGNRGLIQDTHAVDIIQGGSKVNALPEYVKLEVNNRVAYGSSVELVKQNYIDMTKKVAKEFNCSVNAFGKEVLKSHPTTSGMFTLSTNHCLPQAPVTKFKDNKTWEILAGTTRHIFEDYANYKKEEANGDNNVVIVPSILTGNTDTRYYWELTDNIYRFTPARKSARFNMHAANERVEMDAHIELVAFYYELIQNINEFEKQ